MADKSLNRIFFPIFSNTSDDASRSKPDPIGVFSCNMNAARFLDIDNNQFILPIITRERETTGRRSLTLADGTVLTSQSTSKGTIKTEIVTPFSVKGSRTVIIKTGKQIADSERKKNKSSAFHTISFRFPSFCTILNIAEALGEVIPSAKIKNPPTATDIWGYFTVKGGRKYPIMLKEDAESDTNTDVPANSADANTLIAKGDRVKRVRRAAGNA